MNERAYKQEFMHSPLLPLAGAFVLGILVEGVTGLNAGILLGATVIFAISAYFSGRSLEAPVYILLAFLALGGFCYFAEFNGIRDDRMRMLIDGGLIASGDPVEIEGRLINPPEPTANGFILSLETEKITVRGLMRDASGVIRLYAADSSEQSAEDYEMLDLRDGSHIAVACNITREEEFQNPGVASRIELLDRQSIDATASIKSPLLIENYSDGSTGSLLDRLYATRQGLIEQFRAHFDGSTAGVLNASMLGDKYFLDKPTADVFREGGTFHVLVISGLHITFIGGLLLLFVRLFTRRKLIRFIFVTASLWSYALAVGADVPVVRACLMFTILLFSHVIHRQGNLLNSLGACVIVLLAWRPSDIFSPSFQLTVVSVTAIVAIAFPLVQKFRSIGSWMPTASTPFPPRAPRFIVRLCEMLFWRPAAWNIESSRQIWSARIFKYPYFKNLVATGWQRTTSYIFEGLLVSLIVQICLLPIMIIYFHRVSPISIPMNLWVGVAIALESFGALIAIVLSQVSEFFAAPFISLTEFLNYLLVAVPGFFVRSEWASWRVPNYSSATRLVYGVYFVPVVFLAFVLYRWDPFGISNLRSYKQNALETPEPIAEQANSIINSDLGNRHDNESHVSNFKTVCRYLSLRNFTLICTAAVAVLAGLIVIHPFSTPRADGRLHIDFLDVGQGDSALVTFPDGTTMMVDGGGRMEYGVSDDDAESAFILDAPGVGEAVVSPVLWEKGYSRIDHILATHADADHIQGLGDVAANFRVGDALFGRMPAGDPEFARVSTVLTRRGVPSQFVFRGGILRFGDANVEVLYPLPDTSPDAPSDNNHSVVIRIVYGNRAFLLTGDIEREAERELVSGGGTLKADLIKVPHHGSRTSSTEEFVEAVDPQFAIISVGRHSRFGHPTAEVVERWKSAGANVMTTGERGMISVSTNGSDLVIEMFKK